MKKGKSAIFGVVVRWLKSFWFDSGLFYQDLIYSPKLIEWNWFNLENSFRVCGEADFRFLWFCVKHILRLQVKTGAERNTRTLNIWQIFANQPIEHTQCFDTHTHVIQNRLEISGSMQPFCPFRLDPQAIKPFLTLFPTGFPLLMQSALVCCSITCELLPIAITCEICDCGKIPKWCGELTLSIESTRYNIFVFGKYLSFWFSWFWFFFVWMMEVKIRFVPISIEKRWAMNNYQLYVMNEFKSCLL